MIEIMEKILDRINKPDDLKKLNLLEKNKLAEEIREYILEVVSKNGGHLASNLGVVELTIALHSVFDLPQDKIVWDVQKYRNLNMIVLTQDIAVHQYQWH